MSVAANAGQHLTDPDRVGLDDRFARELPELGLKWSPAEVPQPELAILNEGLAVEIGLDPDALSGPSGVALLAGNRVPEGARPVALAYAGHQFGHYSPRLGDGRALLLGEMTDVQGRTVDLHLKGSGRTPFARGGDGRATIGPMLREYLIAEALHALGVPTTRALAVVTTGQSVRRRAVEPGAVLTRVAASHIRVGTFEYAVRLGGEDLVRRLADHSIARHHPHAAESEEPCRALLGAVVEAQAGLVARWMLLGFVHGVMNTDNMTISGEGIDYGPCAFMDRFDPATVFSSIDHGGRYAYGNQPSIAVWNLARLAETLVGLLSSDSGEAVAIATEEVERFGALLDGHWRSGMQAKLGLGAAPSDDELFEDLLKLLHGHAVDHTAAFRDLGRWLRGDPARLGFLREGGSEVAAWLARWRTELDRNDRSDEQTAAAMDQVNPVYIPRNHRVEEALDAATAGDLAPFRRLLDVVTRPYDERADHLRYAEPAPVEFTDRYQTFCGT